MAAPLAQATVVPQRKGNPCHAVWSIGDASAQAGGGTKPYTLTCPDGDASGDTDGAANGSCAVSVNACVGSTAVAGCTAGPLTAPVKIPAGKAKRAVGLVAPPATAGPDACGTPDVVTLKLKGKNKDKPSKPFVLVMKSKGSAGKGVNKLKLVCTKGNGGGGGTHNFTITSQSKLNYCLTGCDATSNVPVCVVNRFRESAITGTVNLQSGEMQSNVNLLADTYVRLGFTDLVCPRCDNGKCRGGKRDGQSCTVNGRSTVLGSSPSEYNLSTDCIPEGNPAGILQIDLPLTTETYTSPPGPRPCESAVGQRFDDACAPGASCVAACSTVIAPKGGINQTCCSNDPNLPCFPTRGGGTIQRTGTRAPLTPAWPDPAYPKTSAGSQLVATFCIARTGDSSVDGTTGLPGPGAIILPATQTLTASQ